VPGIERRRPGEAGASARPVVEAGSAEPPGLAGLDGLLAAVRSAGLAVTATIGTSTTSLPADVDAAAFRIVQEALTNVIRHAGATSARIVAGVDDGLLRLVVADDGRGDAAGSTGGLSEGTGIAGMRERTALLGGTLTAEPSPDGGFVVIAVLPIAAAPPREETEESR
jgi:signal transduction histidine kinase